MSKIKKITKIDWLGECPKCKTESATAWTEKGKRSWLYYGDQLECEKCKNKGVVDCEDGHAWAVWEGEEEDV